QLEEYGLPRMISKKMQNSGIIDFEKTELTLHRAIETFNNIGKEHVLMKTMGLHKFDRYILDYFYDGIKIMHDS
ncbi:MAG: hypothetical protein ABFD81_00045, partial [Syntrophaceae bacterium]